MSDEEYDYDLFVLKRPAPGPGLRGLDFICRPLARWLYFSWLGKPRMNVFAKRTTRQVALDHAQRIAEKFPCVVVLVECGRDDEPQIILRMVTDPTVEGFRAELGVADE